MGGVPDLHLAQDPNADALLARDPLALLIGMVLDQQIPLEWAFTGPLRLRERLGHDYDAAELAGYDPDELAALFSRPAALHRFPGSMARRVQQLCQHLVERYDGDPAAVWRGVGDGAELRRRVEALPGFGKQKAQIFVALLGKQLGVRPAGWRDAAGEFAADGSHKSVADITGPDSLAKVRAYKQHKKAAAKGQPSGSES